MKWNWQQPGWRKFTWNVHSLRASEDQFLLLSGKLAGVLSHLSATDQNQLIAETLADEAVTTSEIEGEILNRASVQSSLRRQLGIETAPRRISPAEQGIAEMMIDLHRSFAIELSPSVLFEWHRKLMRGRKDLDNTGAYRTSAEPMQVVSGPVHARKIHYEAPPSSSIPHEMDEFVNWFNRTAPAGPEPLPALTRSGIAHLYFESIHPFEDGNGRIGRGIAEKALSQATGQPALAALAKTILRHRADYYRELEKANKSNTLTNWLAWHSSMVLEAQLQTLQNVDFLIEKTKLLARLRGQLNSRQEKALLRILREGPSGFTGGLSAANYAKITGASPATATRDLAGLVDKGALVRTGQLKHARYWLAMATAAANRPNS